MATETDPPGNAPGSALPPASSGRGAGWSAAGRGTTLIDQLGGIGGLIYSSIPAVVFASANAIWSLRVATIVALAAAVVACGIRLLRRERLAPAFSGLLGVLFCVFIAHRVGDAKGYFLFGIWTALIYAAILLASILVRRPLIGVVWNLLTGADSRWRGHRRTMVAYDVATAFWALVFLARYLTQSWLYDDATTGWLAVSRIAMGWPLTVLCVAVTVALVRWADRSGTP
ncbi:MAG: DUF3159 domain-containing protein [Gordonia sp. (in: high G+C Gram-positive bacteria)]